MKRWIAAAAVGVMGLMMGGATSPPADGAGQAAEPPGLEQAVGEFWTRWEGGRPSDALRRAASSPDLQRVAAQAGERADDFQNRSGGRCLGHTQICRRALGENVQYVAFFALYDPLPLRVQLLMYRAKDTWSMIAVRTDSDPSRWLGEAAQSQMPTPPQAPEQ